MPLVYELDKITNYFGMDNGPQWSTLDFEFSSKWINTQYIIIKEYLKMTGVKFLICQLCEPIS